MKKTTIISSLFFIYFILSIPTTSAEVIEYIPENSTITQGIYTEISDVSNDKLLLKIFTYNLPEQLFGISFDLGFDSEKVEFLSSDLKLNNTEGEYLLIQKDEEGIYNFAVSAKKGYLLNFDEEKSIIEISFAIKNSGDLDIVFSNVKILESSYDTKAITDKTIEALGGTLITDFRPENLTVTGSFLSPFIVFVFMSFIVIIFIVIILFYKKLLIQKKNPIIINDRIFRIRKIY